MKSFLPIVTILMLPALAFGEHIKDLSILTPEGRMDAFNCENLEQNIWPDADGIHHGFVRAEMPCQAYTDHEYEYEPDRPKGHYQTTVEYGPINSDSCTIKHQQTVRLSANGTRITRIRVACLERPAGNDGQSM